MLPYLFNLPAPGDLFESLWWETPVPLEISQGDHNFVILVVVESVKRQEKNLRHFMVRVRRAGGEIDDIDLPVSIFSWKKGFAFFEEGSDQGGITFVPDTDLPNKENGLFHYRHA